MKLLSLNRFASMRYSIEISAILGILCMTASHAFAQGPDSCNITGPPAGHVALNTDYNLSVTGSSDNGVYKLAVTDAQTGGTYYWFAVGCGPSAIHTFNVVNQADGSYNWYGSIYNCLNLDTEYTVSYNFVGPYTSP